MTSIKEIAKLAEVSVGTASFVLNGKGDQMRISEATQRRVIEVAKSLGYRPNISARRLRSGGEKVVPVLAVLWTLDTRASLVSRFLNGIQDHFINQTREFELLIQPYESSKIDKIKSLITGTRFNGAIIANASERDQHYLENAEINVPIVLYHRNSKKYSTVSIDNYKNGMMVADLFANRGHQQIGMVIPNVSSQAVHLRKEGFLDGARSSNIQVSPKHIIFENYSEEGGYQAAKKLVENGNLPSALFFLGDQMAIGALAAFHEMGVSVPQDIEIMGHDNYGQTRFSIPSLSTVHLPVEDMAARCVDLMLDLIEHKVKAPVSTIYDTSIVIRKSCGDFLDKNESSKGD
ncbi:LacI family DNA-binding transcriptional regulator [Peribacillus glennii]|uniref:LacI family transcriptional regulator n=1 Tax=Peribacillus glennii TaxID=2303991 RepID=A0A372LEZ0_9BACI|nr:LacI family DNA-binding transcriptional regulator [Peribacillus glennii]RFU63870.1 LacI family transcriptional regulator [Peribacillus glennii]